jgi:hypothetical protein
MNRWLSIAARRAACDDGCVHPDPHEELTAAIAAERAAWSRVKGKLPGAPGFDPVLWKTWQEAVQRCRAARQAIDGAAGGLQADKAAEP